MHTDSKARHQEIKSWLLNLICYDLELHSQRQGYILNKKRKIHCNVYSTEAHCPLQPKSSSQIMLMNHRFICK